jgi:hypothetical protein
MGQLVFSVPESDDDPVEAVTTLITDVFEIEREEQKWTQLFAELTAKYAEKTASYAEKTESYAEKTGEEDHKPGVLTDRFRETAGNFFQNPTYQQQMTAQIATDRTRTIGQFNFVFFESSADYQELHEVLTVEDRNDHQAANEAEALLFYISAVFAIAAKERPIQVSPNWFFGGSQGQIISGGPGGLPVPPDNPHPDHVFTPHGHPDPEQQGQVSAYKGQGTAAQDMHIYVLDTIPEQSILQAVIANNTVATNPLIAELLAEWTPVGERIQTSDYLDLEYYTEFNPEFNDPDYGIECVPYDLADHGLFIAGLIHSVLRPAEKLCRPKIHLIQALNEMGAGTLKSIIWAINRVAEYLHPEQLAIVNCSFRLSFHLDSCLDDAVVEPCADPVELPFDFLEQWMCVIIDVTNEDETGAVADLFDSLTARGIMVCAAAGNDTLQVQPGPHQFASTPYPAAFDQVLGIGALGKNMKPAVYTNIPDKADPPEGYWAFGGEVDPHKHSDNLSRASRQKGIIGIYTRPFYLVSGEKNDTGWAAWAGSSFATGVATGYFARYLCRQAPIPDKPKLGDVDPAFGAPELNRPVIPLKQGH